MKKEYLEWVARKQGYARAMDIIYQHRCPEDLDEIDNLKETAIKDVRSGRYSDYEKEVMIEAIRQAFRDYKDFLKMKYFEVV